MSVFLSSGSPSRSVVEVEALQRVQQLVLDRLLDQEARARAADLALVEEDAGDDAFDGLVDRGVVEDDVGALAAQFEGDLLVGAGDLAGDGLADRGRAGERDLVHVLVLDEGGARVPVPGKDVHDTLGQARLAADVREEQRGERGRLGGLEDHRVAGGERRGDLPGQHQEGEVPGDDLARDAEGAGFGP